VAAQSWAAVALRNPHGHERVTIPYEEWRSETIIDCEGKHRIFYRQSRQLGLANIIAVSINICVVISRF